MFFKKEEILADLDIKDFNAILEAALTKDDQKIIRAINKDTHTALTRSCHLDLTYWELDGELCALAAEVMLLCGYPLDVIENFVYVAADMLNGMWTKPLVAKYPGWFNFYYRGSDDVRRELEEDLKRKI